MYQKLIQTIQFDFERASEGGLLGTLMVILVGIPSVSYIIWVFS